MDSLNPEFNICKIAGSTLGIQYSEEAKQKFRGNKNIAKRPEVRQKLKEARIGRIISKETKQKMSDVMKGENNPMYRKFHSEESKNKNRNSQKGEKSAWWGKHHTKETKQKMSNTQQNKQKVTCPHCGKQAKENVIYRWHFDNCKYQPLNT